MAITGPFSRIVSIPGLSWSSRTGYRQKPINGAPLNYDFGMFQNLLNDPQFTTWSVQPWEHATYQGIKDLVYKKAYNRLMAEVSVANAQLGATLGERHQAMKMISGRVKQLTSAALALKNFNLTKFVEVLQVKRKTVRESFTGRAKKWRSTASDMGGVWLEYSYGWKPLVEDIYNAHQVLQQRPPSKVVKGRARGIAQFTQTDSLPHQVLTTVYRWTVRRLIQMHISIGNSTLWQANELGLTNPAAVAWELVPFSFVVDWFLPVGAYLQSLTDFVGLDQKDAFVTEYDLCMRDFQDVRSPPYLPAYTRKVAQASRMQRRVGIPSIPSLHSRFTGFYSARGANAIVLLVSTLKELPNVKVKTAKRSNLPHVWDNPQYY